MITDIEMEAMNELEILCKSKPLKEMVSIITDMLGNLDSEEFYQMSDKNKQEFLIPYSEKLNQYMVQEHSIEEHLKKQKEEQTVTKERKIDFTYEDAKQDILTYLSGQDEDYFLQRNTSKQNILENSGVIDMLASEHYRCVIRYCCDRTWSCEDACDSDPGFYQKAANTLEEKIHAVGMGKSRLHSSITHQKEPEKTIY